MKGADNMLTIINFAVMFAAAVIGWNILTGIVFPLIAFVITAAVSLVVYVITLAVEMVFVGFGIAIAWAFFKKAFEQHGGGQQLSDGASRDEYIHDGDAEAGRTINTGGREHRNSYGRDFSEHREYPNPETIKQAKNFFNIR